VGCEVLIFGYTNFNRYLWNPAERVVDLLNGTKVGDCRVSGVKLPVKYNVVKEIVPKYLEERDPSVAIGVGLNPMIRKVAVELASSNLISFEVPDEGGFSTDFDFIEGEGLEVLQTRLPVEKIYRDCVSARALQLRFTLGIGSYLCNVLGYIIMKWAWMKNRVGGFLHVPPDTNLAMRLNLSNFISIDEIVSSVKCVIEKSVEEVKKDF